MCIRDSISPPVESPGQESDNDSLPGQGYTSSHASSDEQPAILLLDDSTSSSHANQRRQASHPSDTRSTHSDPTAILALSLVVAPCERLRCACATHGRSSRCVFIQRKWWRNFADPVHCMRRLHRAQYELGRWPIQTAGGKCIRHNHAPDRAADPANWRTSCLSASLMRDASRKVADSCSNAAPRIFETAAAGIRRGLTKTAISVPQHAKFSLRGYRPAPRLG